MFFQSKEKKIIQKNIPESDGPDRAKGYLYLAR